MENTSTSLVPARPRREVISYEQAKDFALVAAQSGFFLSKEITNQNKAMALIMIGRELGLGPAASIRGIYLINGVPSLSARVMSSLIKMSGEYDYKTLKREDKVATIAILRLEEGKWIQQEPTCTFTTEDAKRAGLIKPGSGWDKYPRSMCWARALTDSFGIHCPHLASGMPVYAEADEVLETTQVQRPQNAPQRLDVSPPTQDIPDAEIVAPEQPQAVRGAGVGYLPEENVQRLITIAKEKGSSLEAIKMHHKVKNLYDLSKEAYLKIMKVLESK